MLVLLFRSYVSRSVVYTSGQRKPGDSAFTVNVPQKVPRSAGTSETIIYYVQSRSDGGHPGGREAEEVAISPGSTT